MPILEPPRPAELRPVTHADFAAVHALHARIERHDRIPVAMPLEEFEGWARDPHLDLERDTRIAEDEGRMIGWSRVWFRPSGAREERAYVMGGVAPEARGRGTGSRLLRWGIHRSRQILLGTGSKLPLFVGTQCYDFEHGGIRLFRKHGMKAVHWGDEMHRDLRALPDLSLPAGVAIVPWTAERNDEARRVVNESFADHWGSTPRDEAAWRHELAAFGVRLDLSFFAIEERRILGLTRNGHYPGDEAVTGERAGWIHQLGVLGAHRKRGIASALIAASLRAFASAGMTHAALYVDSANPSGANRLYERLGFRLRHRTIVHQLQV